ncbi:hypothetical protein CIRMBP1295_02327 [Enterococcus cecorum]|nr:hypothetical protein CIRMBP1295_02327 [Enterococcus cecorum]
MGLPISRKEMANWHIKSSQYYFEPLYELLREKLLTQSLLHADETAYRVLENDTSLTDLLLDIPFRKTSNTANYALSS